MNREAIQSLSSGAEVPEGAGWRELIDHGPLQGVLPGLGGVAIAEASNKLQEALPGLGEGAEEAEAA